MTMVAAEYVTRHPFVEMAEDAHGRQKPVYGTPEVLRGGFAPSSSTEEPRSYGAVTVHTPAAIYLTEFRTDLSPHDEWEARGERFAVEGTPQAWRSPFTGWRPGTVIQLQRSEG